MTISIAWRRKFLGVDEIIFASDSRLSAGYRWDCAQKIFPIDGPNFCISFAGDSDFGFPCIFQFQCMVRNYRRYANGAAPIADMTKDFLAVCNQMFLLVDDRKMAQFNKTEFLVSGYDFDSGQAFQREIRYDSKKGFYARFEIGGLKSAGKGHQIGFVGDQRKVFFEALGRLIDQQGTVLNYQPLEALNLIIGKQGKGSSIGGFPQMVKVYRHRNYLPYAVRKSSSDEEIIALFGRPLLPYERTFYPIVTLDRFGREDFIAYPHGPSNRSLAPPPQLRRPTRSKSSGGSTRAERKKVDNGDQ